jgi:hypothetical protein
MKTVRKTILTSLSMPFRLVIFIFGGRGENKWCPAGRYTRPEMMKEIEPAAANQLLG